MQQYQQPGAVQECLEREAQRPGALLEGRRCWAARAASRAQAVWCSQQMQQAPEALRLPEYQCQIELGALLVVRPSSSRMVHLLCNQIAMNAKKQAETIQRGWGGKLNGHKGRGRGESSWMKSHRVDPPLAHAHRHVGYGQIIRTEDAGIGLTAGMAVAAFALPLGIFLLR